MKKLQRIQWCAFAVCFVLMGVQAFAASSTLRSVTVAPSSAQIAAGGTRQYVATGHYRNGTTKDLTALVSWSSSQSTVATVSAAGMVKGVKAGSATIKVSYGSMRSSGSVTVTAPTATLVSLAVTPASASIAVGSTQQFAATGSYSDGTTKTLTTTVTWTSSNGAMATISAGGLATGVAAGSATITATSGSVTASSSLTVTAVAATLKSIAVTPASASIQAGGTQQFAATGTYSDGTTKTLSGVTWVSSTTTVATVSASGVATGVTAGTVTITATSGSVTASSSLTVTAVAVTLKSIAVTPASASIAVGSTQQYAATGSYSYGTTKPLTSVTWVSSTTTVASVSASGLATGVAAGTVTISATSGSLSGSAVLTVTAAASGSGGCDGAGNCYIYAGATGAGTGTSWANAYKGFGTGAGQVNPAKMQRGAVYWIAAGSYSAQTFNTPANGTQTITIEGALPSSHGPATDWNDSYAGTAVFGGSTTNVLTDYWVFEGQTRGADWQSSYSIMFDLNGVSGKGGVITNRSSSGASSSNLIFDYVEVRGSNMNMTYNSGQASNCSTYCDGGFYTGSPTNNLYVGHSWIHDVGDTQFQSNINSVGNSNGSSWIIEYNYISRDHTGDQANGAHSEAFSSTVQNMVVRYNYFQDIISSGVITDATGGNPDVGPWYIYGNVVFWTNNAKMTSNSTASGLGDGFVSFFGGTLHGTSYIVHNTIANIGVQPHCAEGGVACAMYFLYASGSGTASWVIENNMVWNAHGQCVYNGGNTWTISADYNTVYGGAAGTMQNCGTHAQTVSSTNPFVSWDGSGTQLAPYESLNFSLKADTTAGDNSFATLPAGCTPGVNCMNVDMTGKTFGAAGTYERGALQR